MSDDEIVHDWESDCYVLHAANTSLREERERLRAENEKLRAALKPFAAMMDGEHMQAFAEALDSDWTRAVITIGDLRAAADALKETGDE